MYRAKYLNAKKTISAILSSCEAGFLSGEQAATAILATIIPTMERAIGMEQYFSCARGWLTQILLVEPKLSLRLLTERLRALREISPEMRQALGGIAGRMTLLCRV